MDPAKRICLKNLPPDVTKKDIADLIRLRSRSQPQYIDLGLNEDGTPRRYAFVSVEGLKGVLEAINGAPIRGFNVIAEQCKKPHFGFTLAEAKRKREREEQEADDARKQRVEQLLERWNAKGDTITKDLPPKSFYHSRQRYAKVAAEIAAKSREQNKQKFGLSHMPPSTHVSAQLAQSARHEATTPAGASRRSQLKRHKPERTKKPETPVEPVAPPPPPQPTKEERKLTGLQAKLAALREKMSKPAVSAPA